MRWVSSSELKAKLARYLRLVRQGEVVEVRDRGIPIATIRGIESTKRLVSDLPVKDPAGLAKLVSDVDCQVKTDAVGLLLKDRRQR